MNNKKIGKFISKLRKNKKMTQEELSALLFINSKTISKWENGITIPDTIYLYELSKIFNISTDEILNAKREPKYYFLKLKYIIPCFLFLIIFLFMLFYFINNYNRVKMYNIHFYDKIISISGNSIFTQKTSIININNIEFTDNINVRNVTIQIKNNDRVFYSNIVDYDKVTPINIALSSFNISINNIEFNYDITLDEISNTDIKIIYTDSDYKDHILNIKLKYDLVFSNNKIFY